MEDFGVGFVIPTVGPNTIQTVHPSLIPTVGENTIPTVNPNTVIPTLSLPYNVTNVMYIDVDYGVGYIDEYETPDFVTDYIADYIPDYVTPTIVEYDISTSTPTTDLPSPGKF